jgi:peroxiredoxin
MTNASRRAIFAMLVLSLAGPAHAQQAKGGGSSKRAEYDKTLPADTKKLSIGDAAPDFSLKGVDEKVYTLADFKDADVLVVAFLSNHCPYSHAAEARFLPFVKEMAGRSVAFVGINPNSPDAVTIDELGYSKYNDSYDEMKLYAKERGFTFPYLYDGDTQKTAKAYGCLCTPHVFVFDRERKLRYAGRWDDSRFEDPATVKAHEGRDAVEALLAGKPVVVEMTKPMGCSTKWLESKGKVAEVQREWESAPVVLETIDLAGIAKLAKNDTKKVRLINVWATWCAPCVAEFPGLVSLSRQFANRDFELITISVDDPAEMAKAKSFLERQRAAVPNRVQRSLKAEERTTNNYLFSGADMSKLMEALDPAAPGPVPYTVVIAPGGKVLYRNGGEINVAELRTKLLDTMGVYYPETGR